MSSLKSLSSAIRRRIYMMTGNGLDTKRPRAWQEYGYPDEICFDMLYRAYHRVDVAHGAVERLVEKCWQSLPWLIEGGEDQNKKELTPRERAWGRLFKDLGLWEALKDADRRRLVGRYSAIVLHWADGLRLDRPVEGASKLARMTVLWADQIKAIEWDEDPASATYGDATMYSVREAAFGAKKGGDTRVHADRVFVLGDMSGRSIGFLEPGYNQLVNLEKITGGSGESILKNSARQIGIEYDKEVDLASIAESQGLDPSELRDLMDDQARDLGEGIDALMAVQGGRIVPLVSAPVDPTGPFDTAVSAFSASVRIPTKIIIGNQQGERASTEDARDFAARCQGRRVSDLSGEIMGLMRLLERGRLLDLGDEATIMWDDLTEATRSERLASAKTMAEISAIGLTTGAPYFSDEEIREAAGYDGTADPYLPDDED